ncbi:hypothetical protein [Nostoc sp. ChiQUE01b]|uniref:hypothetical protein n=1 Tax=Nostoc sp. ChiQUE01b TaxID=3075376 RepID=UPI002AD43A51|nr:hypothetical protein [Nostoc sp. ChiQUE01b]MDZ8257454.1 hypothetical protein [Nostoc sp. ChiQUE01b]
MQSTKQAIALRERSTLYEPQPPIPAFLKFSPLRLQAAEYDHPLYLAIALENLANQAWDEVDQIYPNL